MKYQVLQPLIDRLTIRLYNPSSYEPKCFHIADAILFAFNCLSGSTLMAIISVLVAKVAGPASFIGVSIATVHALMNASCLSEMTSCMRRGGSSYTIAYSVLGEFAGFLVGWCMFISLIGLSAVTAQCMSWTIDALINGRYQAWGRSTMSMWTLSAKNLHPPLAIFPDILAGLFIFCIFVTLYRTNVGWSIINGILSIANTVFLFALITVGIAMADYNNISLHGGLTPLGFSSVFEASIISSYLYVGMDFMPLIHNQMYNNARDTPRAMMYSVSIMGLFNIILTFMVPMIAPWYLLNVHAAYPSAVQLSHKGDWVQFIVNLSPLFGLAAALPALMYSQAKLAHMMAYDGVLSQMLYHIDLESHIPTNAVFFTSVFTWFLAVFFDVQQCIGFINISSYIGYTIVCVCLILTRLQSCDTGRFCKCTKVDKAEKKRLKKERKDRKKREAQEKKLTNEDEKKKQENYEIRQHHSTNEKKSITNKSSNARDSDFAEPLLSFKHVRSVKPTLNSFDDIERSINNISTDNNKNYNNLRRNDDLLLNSDLNSSTSESWKVLTYNKKRIKNKKKNVFRHYRRKNKSKNNNNNNNNNNISSQFDESIRIENISDFDLISDFRSESMVLKKSYSFANDLSPKHKQNTLSLIDLSSKPAHIQNNIPVGNNFQSFNDYHRLDHANSNNNNNKEKKLWNQSDKSNKRSNLVQSRLSDNQSRNKNRFNNINMNQFWNKGEKKSNTSKSSGSSAGSSNSDASLMDECYFGPRIEHEPGCPYNTFGRYKILWFILIYIALLFFLLSQTTYFKRQYDSTSMVYTISSTFLMLLLLTFISLFTSRYRFLCPEDKDDKFWKLFRVRLVPVIPFVAITLNIVFLANLTARDWIGFVSVICAGFVVYFTFSIRSSRLVNNEKRGANEPLVRYHANKTCLDELPSFVSRLMDHYGCEPMPEPKNNNNANNINNNVNNNKGFQEMSDYTNSTIFDKMIIPSKRIKKLKEIEPRKRKHNEEHFKKLNISNNRKYITTAHRRKLKKRDNERKLFGFSSSTLSLMDKILLEKTKSPDHLMSAIPPVSFITNNDKNFRQQQEQESMDPLVNNLSINESDITLVDRLITENPKAFLEYHKLLNKSVKVEEDNDCTISSSNSIIELRKDVEKIREDSKKKKEEKMRENPEILPFIGNSSHFKVIESKIDFEGESETMKLQLNTIEPNKDNNQSVVKERNNKKKNLVLIVK